MGILILTAAFDGFISAFFFCFVSHWERAKEFGFTMSDQYSVNINKVEDVILLECTGFHLYLFYFVWACLRLR